MRIFFHAALLATALLFLARPAAAESIDYFQDPVYQKINADDSHPMEELLELAQKGDPRAQYILGDLYGKGKGGLGKNRVKSRYWFETAALNGYSMAFIRLAAQAKNARDYVSAYKWYMLDISDSGGDERKWSLDQRDKLEKKLSKNDLREAKEAANTWRAKREKERAERRAKELEALRVTQEKEKKKAAKKAASKKGKKDKTAKKETKEKEFNYND